jgi:hypothetical protein
MGKKENLMTVGGGGGGILFIFAQKKKLGTLYAVGCLIYSPLTNNVEIRSPFPFKY